MLQRRSWVPGPSERARQITAQALAAALAERGLPVFARGSARGSQGSAVTASHQFALEAAQFGGGQAAARRLALARLYACGIGLPIEPVAGDVNGLRLGVPEIVRLGFGPEHMGELGGLIASALAGDARAAAPAVTALRHRVSGHRGLRYVRA